MVQGCYPSLIGRGKEEMRSLRSQDSKGAAEPYKGDARQRAATHIRGGGWPTGGAHCFGEAETKPKQCLRDEGAESWPASQILPKAKFGRVIENRESKIGENRNKDFDYGPFSIVDFRRKQIRRLFLLDLRFRGDDILFVKGDGVRR